MAESRGRWLPGSQAQSYLDRLHANWSKAGTAIARRPR